jgi:histidinol-phosphate aminotransferase
VRQKYGVTHIAKLASNENPLGASPQVVSALQADADFSAVYSDAASARLRDVLADYTGVSAENIVTGNGSEDILHMLALAFLNPGDRVVTLIPSFGLHEIFPRMMGADVTLVGVDQRQQFDVAAWEQALSTPAKMVILAIRQTRWGACSTKTVLPASLPPRRRNVCWSLMKPISNIAMRPGLPR